MKTIALKPSSVNSKIQGLHIDAEQCFLGTLIYYPEAISKHLSFPGDEFTLPKHAALFDAIKTTARDTNHNTGFSLIINRMKELNAWKEGDDLTDPSKMTNEYFVNLVDKIDAPGNLPSLISMIRTAHRQRSLIKCTGEIHVEANADLLPLPTILKLEEKLLVAATNIATFSSNSELIGMETVIEEMAKAPKAVPIPTGIARLDSLLAGGLWPAEVTILAGRPSQGKTALALSMLLRSMETGHGILFSLEMNKKQIIQRFLALVTGINLNKVRGEIPKTDIDLHKIKAALDQMKKWKLQINDASVSTLDIRMNLRNLVISTKERPSLVVIDYLQLLRPSTTFRENREQQISNMSRGIKAICKDFNVPVLALSQLNRAVFYDGSDASPELHHLRESGSIEQDADCVLAIHHHKNTPDIDLKILKQRNGPRGTVPLFWQPEIAKFTGKEN
jgi:replicative DNA helicase